MNKIIALLLLIPSLALGQAVTKPGGGSKSAVDATGTSTVGLTAPSFTGSVSSSTATSTGSTASRTLADRFADAVNVKDYGAKGDGATDDTAAIRAASTAAADGATIYFPRGTYMVSSGVTFAQVNLMLDGQPGAKIVTTSAFQAGNVLTFTGGVALGTGTVPSAGITVRDLWFDNYSSTVNRTSGAYLFFDPGANNVHANTRILDDTFHRGATAVDWERAFYDQFVGNYVIDNSIGLIIDDVTNADAGDSLVSGNAFYSPANVTGAVGVLQRASGGSRIVSNKFNVLTTGYQVNLTGSTSIINFVGNSVENCTTAGIKYADNGLYFTGVQIAANEFNVNATHIDLSGATSATMQVEIVGNSIRNGTTGITVGSGAADVVVSGNAFSSSGTVGPTSNWVTTPGVCDQSGAGTPASHNVSCANGSVYRQTDGVSGAQLWTRVNGGWSFTSATNIGTVTLSGGSGSVTTGIRSGTLCTCTDQTAANPVKCSVSGTTLTAAGTGSDVIGFVCF